MIFAGVSGSAVADAAAVGSVVDSDDEKGGVSRRVFRGTDRDRLGDGTDHSAFHSHDHLRGAGRSFGRPHVPCRDHPRAC